jgi:hypothetical protein
MPLAYLACSTEHDAPVNHLVGAQRARPAGLLSCSEVITAVTVAWPVIAAFRAGGDG